MQRIPRTEKFRGDNSVDFKKWVTQFERNLGQFGTENGKRLNILF